MTDQDEAKSNVFIVNACTRHPKSRISSWPGLFCPGSSFEFLILCSVSLCFQRLSLLLRAAFPFTLGLARSRGHHSLQLMSCTVCALHKCTTPCTAIAPFHLSVVVLPFCYLEEPFILYLLSRSWISFSHKLPYYSHSLQKVGAVMNVTEEIYTLDGNLGKKFLEIQIIQISYKSFCLLWEPAEIRSIKYN